MAPTMQRAVGKRLCHTTVVPGGRPRLARCSAARASVIDTMLKPITSAGQIANLNEGIATFYDSSSRMWEDMWGEHMHHGYYPKDAPPKSNQQAQIDMIEETLKFAGVTSIKSMVDVGCGIGGSSRYIAKKFGRGAGHYAQPKAGAADAERANALSRAAGLGEQVSFQVGDALQQPFADSSFDLVWSMESGEHMPDKRRFVSELSRVCAPGGAIIVVTWCHRVLQPGETQLKANEQALLDRINEAYYLPQWCSVADYERLFAEAGLTGIKSGDWSEEVAPFWGAVINMALTGKGVAALLGAGWSAIKGALVMPLMARGFQMGLIKFNIIVARKPAQ